ncbi:MAG: protein kinase, partial [Vicinamibacteraceae bacterium]
DPQLADDVAQLLRDHEAADAAGFLEQGLDALDTTTSSPSSGPGPRQRSAAALAPDAAFGGYRVRRVLGRGGMGVVYEAEEIESGRHVALKVLEQRFGDERERERFQREGRLAASIDHEHCVFVFNAAEIDGIPAIAMELMQGTLADRLTSGGALAPATAVDMTLQLVAGLQAAADAGILHRDVKPSNCFIDADGVVKIGDFGISRSVRPAEETALSTRNQLAATPTYASPEQLRGATLDTRTDIYSLGATLYELVTGRRPFAAPDLMSLLMAVANDTPAAPHRLAAAVPTGLSRVILRCLAKKPADRYATYAALAAALEPYSSVSPTPATLGRRFVAGLVDAMVLGILVLGVTMPFTLSSMANPDWRVVVLTMAGSHMLLLLYYGGAEALWARTPGKALLGLTLVDRAGRPPRPAVVLARTLLFAAPSLLQGLAMLVIWGPGIPSAVADANGISAFTIGAEIVTLAGLFCRARRGNGYAALYDLATGCRVVERGTATATDRLAVVAAPAVIDRPAIGARGPFTVLEGGIDGRPGWRPGMDHRLRRRVWIRDLPVGTPALSATRAALARPTRLRWLAGRRTAAEAWDVYEGVAGVPIAEACRTRRSWSEARRWIADVAHELAAQRPDDRAPLELDRVWILDSGRAKLLDDPTGDPTPSGPRLTEAVALLMAVARLARGGQRQPWPEAAERFVDGLATAPPASLSEVAQAADGLLRGRATITRGWRGLSIAGVVVFPVLVGGMMLAGLAIFLITARSTSPERRTVGVVLRALDRPGRHALAPADREAAQIVLAARYRATLLDRALYKPEQFMMLTPAHQALADAIAQRHDDEDAVRAAAARPAVRKLFHDSTNTETPPIGVVVLLGFFASLMVVALFGLVTAVTTRGVVLRSLGFELVTGDGRRATRWRVLARAAIAWSPILVGLLLSTALGGLAVGLWGLMIGLGVALAIMLAGAIVAIARPSRGLQDRLAGTWIVPR